MLDVDKVYFDTMLYLNKFQDPYTVTAETNNMFNKVKHGEFRLIISQTIMMEIYHVLCLPIENLNREKAEKHMDGVNKLYERISTTMLSFPNTEFTEKEFSNIDAGNMIEFVTSVPGSALIDFCGNKMPGSMDFIHIMIASSIGCKKFFTFDKGILYLDANQRKGDMKIIRPYKP